jgi:hypothetical protein
LTPARALSALCTVLLVTFLSIPGALAEEVRKLQDFLTEDLLKAKSVHLEGAIPTEIVGKLLRVNMTSSKPEDLRKVKDWLSACPVKASGNRYDGKGPIFGSQIYVKVRFALPGGKERKFLIAGANTVFVDDDWEFIPVDPNTIFDFKSLANISAKK